QRLGVGKKIGGLQRVLALVEPVVHGPEAPLEGRRLGRKGRVLGVRVDAREGEVAEGEAQLLGEARLEVLDHIVRLAAEGALVVAVLDERDRRVGRPLEVVVRAHGRAQTAHEEGRAHAITFLGRPSRAWRTPSAPGLTPMGETWLQRTTPSPSRTKSARSEVPSGRR